MARPPKIPMLPLELPQQRLHLVSAPPPRPKQFDFKVGFYAEWPEGVMPKRFAPRSPAYLFQAEWTEMPSHGAVYAFYVQARRKHWLLWYRYFDENEDPWKWRWELAGFCNRAGVSEREAATHLLLEYWLDNCRERGRFRRPYDWINEEALFSIADIEAIVRELKDRFALEPRAMRPKMRG